MNVLRSLNGELAACFHQNSSERYQKTGLRWFKKQSQPLLVIIQENPYTNPPPFEKLIGDLKGAYSLRINIKHRLVYQVYEVKKVINVIRLWAHYE